jgi:hypothetical protein
MLALKLGQSLASNTAATISPNTYSIQTTGTEYVTNDGAAGSINPEEGSVSVWTKVSTMSASGFLFRAKYDTDNAIQLFYHASNNEMRFGYKAGGTIYTALFTDAIENDGNWHHIFCTWNQDDNELKIYLDGTLKQTITETLGTFTDAPIAFDIGQNTTDAAFYKGYISNFAFFDRVIDIGKVFQSNMQPINLTGMLGLVGYWKFNEGSGTLALDSSGGGNNGTLVNSPAWRTDTP